jgi:hypothetical protein
MENNKLIFKVKNFNSLSKEVKRYETEEILFKRIAWFMGSVVSFLLIVTIVGYWYAKMKSIEYTRKSEVCNKIRLNLLQQSAYEEAELKRIGKQYSEKFAQFSVGIKNLVKNIRENPSNFTEKEHQIFYAVDKYEYDFKSKKLEPYEELLFHKTCVDLYEQVK